MTPSQLRAAIESADPSTHFFDRKTMRFFGDRMRNYGCRRATVHAWLPEIDPVTNRYKTGDVECWELYRKSPVRHGLQSSHYFACDTFSKVHTTAKD